MKVFLVGDDGAEHDNLISVHRTYAGALKVWEARRLELLAHAKHMLEFEKKQARETLKKGTGYNGEKLDRESIRYYRNQATKGDEISLRIIKNLKCKDPEKMDNYPHETPYIHEREVEE